MRRREGLLILAILGLTAPVLASGEVLRGDVRPLNQERTGQSPTGTVTLTRTDDDVRIELTAQGLSPGMHLAHPHGFAATEPRDARCPTMEADANGDGIIDLIETREASGVTMVPLTDRPVSLEIGAQTYPKANDSGRLEYRQTIRLGQLESAMRKKFGTSTALEQRVVYIHGVPESTRLPDSVRSLEGVPAHVTLPIACAELQPRGN